jgi:hypothetical protein
MLPLLASSTAVREDNSHQRPRARLRMPPGPQSQNLAVRRARRAAGEQPDGPDSPTPAQRGANVGGLNTTCRSAEANAHHTGLA